jgi:hypothetical protein
MGAEMGIREDDWEEKRAGLEESEKPSQARPPLSHAALPLFAR